VDGLTDFHLTLNLGQSCRLQGFNDILIAGDNVVLDEGSDQFGGLGDVLEGVLLLLLEILFERVKVTNLLLLFFLQLEELFLFFLFDARNIDQ
jgi:hypothetical protein